jgi:hypothetical protein
MKKIILIMLVMPYLSMAQTTTASVGYNSGTSGEYNSFLGAYSGFNNTTGKDNVFAGYKSGYTNAGGSKNVFLGRESGFSNVNGLYNVFIGYESGHGNNSGSNNIFIGYKSGYTNINGYFNVFSGRESGYNNTSGSYNVFTGYRSGLMNQDGDYNVFTGHDSGYRNTSGKYNVFTGAKSGYSNTTGSYNVFSGFESGISNTEGYGNIFLGRKSGFYNLTGYYNVFTGHEAGYRNSTGYYNVFSGHESGNANTIGYGNVYTGRQAGYNNSSGHYNVFLGYKAGYVNISGSNNVFLGYKAGGSETGSNKLYIDNSDTAAPLIYGDFSSNKLTVNGYLGVGATNPTGKLEVKGNIKLGLPHTLTGIRNDLSVSTTWGNWMTFIDAYSNDTYNFHNPNNGGRLELFINDGQTNTNKFGVFTILKSGNIGIGTNNPGTWKLAVNGNIRAKEVKVETGWSDFVFENNYNLPTLKEVERHIKEKGHLKDIPSAKEVAENGILLGGMNAKLLQKIEELTLYTIDQEKKLQTQENQIKEQDIINEKLNERLLKLEELVLNNNQKN